MAEVKEKVAKTAAETTAPEAKAPAKKAAPKKAVAVETTEATEVAAAPKKAPAKKAAVKTEAPVVEVAATVAAEPVVEEKAPVKAEKPATKKAAKKAKTPAPLYINGRYVVEKTMAAKPAKGTKPYEVSKKQIKITLVKSTNGSLENHQKTVEALGLKKIHQSVVHYDSAAMRGMIFKVKHLVTVEDVK